MSDIRGKTVLITGAAGDLGRALCRELLTQNPAVLMLVDKNPRGLEDVKSGLSGKETTILTYHCDLSDHRQCSKLSGRLLAANKQPHILIHNAGILSSKSFRECTDEEIEHTFQVNAAALFWLTRPFITAMMESGTGHIATIASAGGLIASAGLGAYSASKFAAVGFHETLRRELRRQKSPVKTTLVCPWYIRTAMVPQVKSARPLLLPILEANDVARKTIRAILKNRPRLYMPPLLYTIPLLRILPVAFLDRILDWFGVDKAAESISPGQHHPSTGKD